MTTASFGEYAASFGLLGNKVLKTFKLENEPNVVAHDVRLPARAVLPSMTYLELVKAALSPNMHVRIELDHPEDLTIIHEVMMMLFDRIDWKASHLINDTGTPGSFCFKLVNGSTIEIAA